MLSIKLVDFLIHAHYEFAKGMRETIAPWDNGPHDPKSLGEQIAKSHVEIAGSLEILKKVILSEKKINCKHLKKDRDIDPDGKTYCMNCNSDLPDKLKPKLIRKQIK